MAGSSSTTLDLEQRQEEEFLFEEAGESSGDAPWRRLVVSRGLFAGLGLALVACASMVASRVNGVQSGGQMAVMAVKNPSTLDMIQAFAMEKGGRLLTEGEVDAVFAGAAGRRGRGVGPPRVLLQGLLGNNDYMSRADGEKVGLSKECMDGAIDDMAKAFKLLAKVLVGVFFDCVVGAEDSQRCQVSRGRVASFLHDLTEECKATGEFCNVTAADMVGGKLLSQSQSMCVPSTCFKEARKAVMYLNKDMLEMEGKAAKADEGADATAVEPEPTAGKEEVDAEEVDRLEFRRMMEFRTMLDKEPEKFSIKCGVQHQRA